MRISPSQQALLTAATFGLLLFAVAVTVDVGERYTVSMTGAVLMLAIGGVGWWVVDRDIRNCRSSEANAKAEHERLLITLSSIGDAIVVTDSKGIVQMLNSVAANLLGAQETLVGKSLDEAFTIVNVSTRQPLENPVFTALDSRAVVTLEIDTLLTRNDGEEIPIEVTAAPIRMRSGKIDGVVLTFRDCSTRWQIEGGLKRREKRFRALFETPLIGIAVGTSGGKYLLEANDAYLDLIGYQMGELPETSLGWGGVEHGQSPLNETAQRELQETGVCRPFERTYVRSDGIAVPVLISATKLLDEKDRIIVFMTDLSSIKQSEAALRDSEKRFSILSESMPQMVWTALSDGRLDYVNRTMIEYSGQSAEELKGWGWTTLLHHDDRESLRAAWESAVATGQQFEAEQRLLRKTGEYRWHLTRALPIYNSKDQITLWIGTNTDIHDQKLAEVLLKEEHHRKDQFLALVAHELRNPLAPLANAVQVFAQLQHDSGQSRELIAIMQRQVKQMKRLIDDLLDLARISQGRIILRRERTSVATVVEAAIESVQPLVNEREHQLTIKRPAQDVWINADAARLTQVLTNLLQNAAKYTEPKGRICLTIELTDGGILFRVRDNGPGLSPQLLNRVFDMFMQIEQTLDRSHGGLGIGLTLVRNLVELHGGTVSAHSDGLGHGSEFLVTLPLMPESSMPVAQPPMNADLNVETLQAMNVLVVDDVQASAKTLAMMLTILGQNVKTAFDGHTAISVVESGSFDVVFLDIAMPRMDGLEVAQELRSNPAFSDLILVALTGFGQNVDRQRSFDAGFSEHLTKPTSINELRDVLQRAILRKKNATILQPGPSPMLQSAGSALPTDVTESAPIRT